MTPSGTPPLPPDVMMQQMPAPLRFMQAAGGATGAVPQADPAILYAADQLTQIAGLMKGVADVLAVKKPALLPILEHMIQAGSALTNELTAMSQGPAPGQGELPTRPQFPQPNDTAGAVSMG